MLAGLGMAALLAVGVVLYLPSGLVAPLWAVIALLVFWGLLAAAGVLWFRGHPLRVLLLAPLAVAVWLAVLQAGEAFGGWTA